MDKKLLITATILGVLSVILGAFAAHGLKELISEEAMKTFETGVKYQMYHAIMLLFVGSTSYLKATQKKVILYLVIIGVIFFSGSIYGLATNAITAFNFKAIALITPIGGLFLIASWLVMSVSFLKLKK